MEGMDRHTRCIRVSEVLSALAVFFLSQVCFSAFDALTVFFSFTSDLFPVFCFQVAKDNSKVAATALSTAAATAAQKSKELAAAAADKAHLRTPASTEPTDSTSSILARGMQEAPVSAPPGSSSSNMPKTPTEIEAETQAAAQAKTVAQSLAGQAAVVSDRAKAASVAQRTAAEAAAAGREAVAEALDAAKGATERLQEAVTYAADTAASTAIGGTTAKRGGVQGGQDAQPAGKRMKSGETITMSERDATSNGASSVKKSHTSTDNPHLRGLPA